MAENAKIKITGKFTVIDGQRFNLSEAWVKWLEEWANNPANLGTALLPHSDGSPYVIAEVQGQRMNLYLSEPTIKSMRSELGATRTKPQTDARRMTEEEQALLRKLESGPRIAPPPPADRIVIDDLFDDLDLDGLELDFDNIEPDFDPGDTRPRTAVPDKPGEETGTLDVSDDTRWFRLGAIFLAVIGIFILVLAGVIGAAAYGDREMVLLNGRFTLPFALGYLVTVPLFALGMVIEGLWFAYWRYDREEPELEDIPDPSFPKRPPEYFEGGSIVMLILIILAVSFGLIAIAEMNVAIGGISLGLFILAALYHYLSKSKKRVIMPMQPLRKVGYVWFTVEPRGKSQWAVCRTESRRAKEYGKPVRLQKGETVQASRSDWADGDDRVYVFDVNGEKLGHMHPDDLKPMTRNAGVNIPGWDRIKGPIPVVLTSLLVSAALFIILMVAGSMYFPNYQVEVAVPVSVFLLIGLVGSTAKFQPTRWNPPKHYEVNDWLPSAETCGWIGLIGFVSLVVLSILDWAKPQSMSFEIIWGVNSIHVVVVLLIIGLGRFTNRYWFSALVAIIIGAVIALTIEPAWWMAVGTGVVVIVLWLLAQLVVALVESAGGVKNFAAMVIVFVVGLAIVALGLQAALKWDRSYLGTAYGWGDNLISQLNGNSDDDKSVEQPPAVVPTNNVGTTPIDTGDAAPSVAEPIMPEPETVEVAPVQPAPPAETKVVPAAPPPPPPAIPSSSFNK